MSRNEGYWNKSRIPELDSLVVYPMPEATTRLAALRSGQVDWIEVPPPDAIPSLKAAGFQISLWPYPHTYPYVLNMHAGFTVQRRAGAPGDELCDRPRGDVPHAERHGETGGAASIRRNSPLFGKPELLRLRPGRAKALLKAGRIRTRSPVKAKIMISTSGSGQMVPIPMNEFLQQNFQPPSASTSTSTWWNGARCIVAHAQRARRAARHMAWTASTTAWGFVDPSTMFRYFCSATLFAGNAQLGSFQQCRRSTICCAGPGDVRRGAADQLLAAGARAGRR